MVPYDRASWNGLRWVSVAVIVKEGAFESFHNEAGTISTIFLGFFSLVAYIACMVIVSRKVQEKNVTVIGKMRRADLADQFRAKLEEDLDDYERSLDDPDSEEFFTNT